MSNNPIHSTLEALSYYARLTDDEQAKGALMQAALVLSVTADSLKAVTHWMHDNGHTEDFHRCIKQTEALYERALK